MKLIRLARTILDLLGEDMISDDRLLEVIALRKKTQFINAIDRDMLTGEVEIGITVN